MQKTAIIVPCYNEAERLDSRSFVEYGKKNKNLHFIFVNDGSTDNTLERIMEMCRSNPDQITCIHLEANFGKAEAVRQGFLNAMKMDFANVGYWDADLAAPLNTISKFTEKLISPEVRMVIGSRVSLLGRRIERRVLRHYLGRLFATCASLVLGLRVYDTQCGAKIFKNTEELKLVFNRRFSGKWTFDVEILARFIMIEKFLGGNRLSDSAVEYPLEFWIDVQGSKIRAMDYVAAGMGLLKIYFFLHSPGAKRRFSSLLKEEQ